MDVRDLPINETVKVGYIPWLCHAWEGVLVCLSGHRMLLGVLLSEEMHGNSSVQEQLLWKNVCLRDFSNGKELQHARV